MNIKVISLSVFLCTFAVPFPAPLMADASTDRYSDCLMMAERAPDRAINEALIWQGESGDMRARHCEAVGLFYLQEYSEAAVRLERIALDMQDGKNLPYEKGKRSVASAAMLADMYGQAANAWLMAQEYVRAETTIEAALSFATPKSPQELELRLDQARIFAGSGDYGAALQEMEYIHQHDKGRKDILVLLASAARGAKRYERAQEALTDYIAIFPNDPAGHLEQGNLYDALGQKALARKSWLEVLSLGADSVVADAARANIERIDLNAQDQ